MMSTMCRVGCTKQPLFTEKLTVNNVCFKVGVFSSPWNDFPNMKPRKLYVPTTKTSFLWEVGLVWATEHMSSA